MKRIIYIVLVFFLSSFSTIQAEEREDTKGITETIYNDSKESISTVYKDSKEAVSTIYTDGKEIVKELYPQIKETITTISSSIGVAAEYTYTAMVRNYRVKGIAQLIQLSIAAILMAFSVYKILSATYLDFREIVYLVLAFLGFVIFLCIPFSQMISNLFNPEWEAIRYILEYSKQMVHGI